MLAFYLIGTGLLGLGLLYWYMAVRMNTQVSEHEQQALAQEQINTYRLRLREFDWLKEHDELDAKEHGLSVNALKRQLLHDLSPTEDEVKGKQFPLFVPGFAFLLLFVAAFYYANGESEKISDWQDTIALLPDLGKRAVMNEGEPLSSKELQQLVLGLRTKLFHDDGDANAWFLLGQVTMTLNDMDSATLAFEQSYKLDPTRIGTMLGLSRAVLMQQEPGSIRRAASLLSEVLRQQPGNVDGLLMVAYVAEQMGDKSKAMSAYNILLASLPDEDPRKSFVKEKMGEMGQAPVAAATPAQNNSADTPSLNKVNVHLTLSEATKGKVPVGATLFVYAKEAGGRPMPAAVVKLSRFDFPMTIQLSDENAMMDSFKLSTLDKVIIYSRVSIDGNIAVAAGELQGQSQVFSIKDTQDVAVIINQVL